MTPHWLDALPLLWCGSGLLNLSVIFLMKWWVLSVLLLFPSTIHPERLELENISIISAASDYQIYERHKKRRSKHEKITTLQMELSAEMARQARRIDRALPRRHSEHD